MTFYKKENYTNVYSALYLLVFRISFQKFYGLHKKVTVKMKSLCVLILRRPLLKLHFDYTKGKCEGKLVAKLILGSQKAVSRIMIVKGGGNNCQWIWTFPGIVEMVLVQNLKCEDSTLHQILSTVIKSQESECPNLGLWEREILFVL